MLVEQTSESQLVDQLSISETTNDWRAKILYDLGRRLGSGSTFPCPFSRNAFNKGLLRFIFVEGNDETSYRHLALGLAEYVELSRDWNGDLNTAYPLLVAFSTDAIVAESVEAYHEFGWTALQRLHELDPMPWHDDVGVDPDTPFWSMCFNGMPLFCNMSNPAHRIRRSRNLGDHFILVINPRERFDVVAGDTSAGRKLRASIRTRIAAYDEAEHCRQLATYGSGAVEWQQYGIIEENAERADRCPFLFRNHDGASGTELSPTRNRVNQDLKVTDGTL